MPTNLIKDTQESGGSWVFFTDSGKKDEQGGPLLNCDFIADPAQLMDKCKHAQQGWAILDTRSLRRRIKDLFYGTNPNTKLLPQIQMQVVASGFWDGLQLSFYKYRSALSS